MKPEDVPDEVMRAFVNGASDSPPEVKANSPEWVRNGLVRALAAYEATVLPAHERQVRAKVMTELFGTREEIAARDAENAKRVPDDVTEICERAAPGQHERQVRERVAAEQRAAAQAIIDSSGEDDDPLTDEVWSRCTQSQDAPATLEDPRTIAIVAYEWFAARLTATCTTPCDAECVELCHEVHEVDWKRVHSPQDCQSARIARGES